MGSTIVAILAAIGGLFLLAGVVALVTLKFGGARTEKATEKMKALPELRSGAAMFVKVGASDAALTPEAAVERGAPRLREISVAAWASRTIVLNAPTIRIGRSLDNDIVLPEVPVSAHHCRLDREGSSFRLKDLGSTNKTFVNGRKVQDVVLRNGDQIRVGPTTFVFESKG